MADPLAQKITASDWDCVDADTQYLTHGIHRYSGKFIPQIARQAIELLTEPQDLVLDPYCGSGTTLLECSLGGRRCIGIDLNPLAVLVSKVKITPVRGALLTDFVHGVEERARPLLSDPLCPTLFDLGPTRLDELTEQAHQDPRWKHGWYRKWFGADILSELIVLHQQILTEPRTECRQLGLVAFSDILRRSSNANGSYPNVMFDGDRQTPPPPTPEFLKRLKQIVRSVAALESALVEKPVPTVLRADARALPIPACTVDAVITHPPYIGSIPYAEYGLLSLTWLGYDPKALDERLTGGRRQAKDVVERFKAGFEDMIRETWRVLKPGGKFFMLLGSPTVRAKRIDLPEMGKELALSAGFSLMAVQQRTGSNRRANLMGNEALLFLQKNQ